MIKYWESIKQRWITNSYTNKYLILCLSGNSKIWTSSANYVFHLTTAWKQNIITWKKNPWLVSLWNIPVSSVLLTAASQIEATMFSNSNKVFGKNYPQNVISTHFFLSSILAEFSDLINFENASSCLFFFAKVSFGALNHSKAQIIWEFHHITNLLNKRK